MSVFKLSTTQEVTIDSNAIDAFDLKIMNIGDSVFDVLVELKLADTLVFISLFQILPGTTWTKEDFPTGAGPFQLLIVTNRDTIHTTNLMVIAKKAGELVTVYTQEECERMK